MAITLPTPTRTAGGDPGKQGQRLPGAGDVPMVNAPRDPGVAFGRDSIAAAGAIGKGIADLGEKVFSAAERQQKLDDATATTDAQVAFEDAGMTEFRRRQTEDDPSRPDFMADFRSFIQGKQEEVLGPLAGKVSPDAYEKVRSRLATSSQAMIDSAGRLQLDAVEKKALDQVDGQINKWSAQAGRDPAFLDTFLGMADDGLSDFSGALTPDQERNARAKARQSIVVSAFSGLVEQKKFGEAEKILGDERFNEDIKPETRRSMATAIETGRKAAQSELRADVRLELEDEIASIRETGAGIGLSRDRIIAAYGDKADRVLKTIADEKAFYRERSTIALNTPEEDAALIQRLTPEGEGFKVEAERRNAVVKAIREKYAAVEKDPVSYVMSQSKELRDAYAAAATDPQALRRAVALSDEMQGRLGVAPENRRTLSDEQAKNMVGSITKVSPELAADAIQTLADQYGDKLWPSVYRDLVRAKLPPEYTVLATTDNPVARKSLAEALRSETQDKGALRRGLAADDAKSIDDGVGEALGDFRATLAHAPNGAIIADRYAKAASLLAYRYAGTMTPSEAAQRAVSDLITDKYDFVQDGQHNARAPRGESRAATDTAARILSGLTADAMPDPGGAPELAPERRKAIALSAAKRGTWVTNETDDGWLLLDVNRQPVFRADGSRIEFKFGDASADTFRPEGRYERDASGRLIPSKTSPDKPGTLLPGAP